MRLDAIIKQMIDATGLRPEYERRAVESLWPDVVGKHIASYTGRIYVKDRTLNVQIISASLSANFSIAYLPLCFLISCLIPFNAFSIFSTKTRSKNPRLLPLR